MTKVAVTGPDGAVHEVEMPEGKTEADATAYVAKTQYGVEPPAPAPVSAKEQAIDTYNAQSTGKKMLDNASTIAGGFNQGVLFDTVDAPSNLFNLTLGNLAKATGLSDTSELAAVPSKHLPWIRDAKNMFTSRTTPKGASRAVDAIRTGAEWTGGGGIAAVKGVQKGVPLVQAAATDIGAGLGAGALEYFSEDNPWAEAAGGIGGMLLTGKLSNAPKAKLSKVDKKAIDMLTRNLRGDTGEALAEAQARIHAGSTGTLADVTRDGGILGVEELLGRSEGSNLQQQIANVQARRAGNIIEETGEILPNVDANPLIDATKGRVHEATSRINQATNAQLNAADQSMLATSQAGEDLVSAGQQTMDTADATATAAAARGEQALLAPVANAPTQSRAGVELTDELGRLDTDLKGVADAQWAKFDDSPAFDASEEVKALDEVVKAKNYAKSDIDALQSAFTPELKRINTWLKKPADPRDIQAVLRDAKQAIHNRAITGETTHADTIMGDVLSELEDILIKSPSTKSFKPAIEATRKRFFRAKPERMAKTLRSTDPETLGDRMGFAGAKGGSTARLMQQADDPAVLEKAHQALRAQIKNEGLTEKTLAKYEDYLSEFPELRRELGEAVYTNAQDVAMQGAMKTLKKTGEQQIKAGAKQMGEAPKAQIKAADAANKRKTRLTDTLNKQAWAEYAAEPKKMIGKWIKGGDNASADKLAGVRKNAEKLGKTEELRSQVREQLTDIIFSTGSDGLPKATGRSIGKFNEMADTLTKSGILTGDEVSRIKGSLERIRELDRTGKVTPAQVTETLNFLDKTIASALAVVGLSKVGAGSSLVLAGRVQSAARAALLKAKNDPATLKRMEEYILNPQTFLDAVENAGGADKLDARFFKKLFNTAGDATGGLLKARQLYSEDQE